MTANMGLRFGVLLTRILQRIHCLIQPYSPRWTLTTVPDGWEQRSKLHCLFGRPVESGPCQWLPGPSYEKDLVLIAYSKCGLRLQVSVLFLETRDRGCGSDA